MARRDKSKATLGKPVGEIDGIPVYDPPVVAIAAPAEGDNPRFDALWAKSWEAIDLAGNPEGLDRNEARLKLWDRLSRFGKRVEP